MTATQGHHFMKRIFLAIVVAVIGGAATLPAAVNTYTLTVTNLPLGAPTTNITASGVTRDWTNATTATTILTNLSSTRHATTNLFNAYGNHGQLGVTLTWLTATQLTFRGSGLTLSAAGNWCSIVTNSSTGTNLTAIMGPPDSVTTLTNQTNFGNWSASYLRLATNALLESSVFGSNYVGRTSTQDVGNKRLTNSVVDGGRVTNVSGLQGKVFALTNGLYHSATNVNPVLSNAVNYGNAFSSPGQGTSSEQFGSGATATTNSATAVGRLATAQGIRSTALGASASAGADDSLALGSAAGAAAVNAIAIGVNSEVTESNSVAIGKDAFVAHADSVAIGNQAQSTDTNQVSIGSPTATVLISGRLTISGTQSNTTFTGANTWSGDIAFINRAVTSLANGNNAGVMLGTNVTVHLSGAAGNHTNCGFAATRA